MNPSICLSNCLNNYLSNSSNDFSNNLLSSCLSSFLNSYSSGCLSSVVFFCLFSMFWFLTRWKMKSYQKSQLSQKDNYLVLQHVTIPDVMFDVKYAYLLKYCHKIHTFHQYIPVQGLSRSPLINLWTMFVCLFVCVSILRTDLQDFGTVCRDIWPTTLLQVH